MLKFLDKERIIAAPNYNRWLVPPAALAIHLSIGMAYGFSVFWLPLGQAIGITAPKEAPAGMGFLAQVFSSQYDWKISMLGWMYTLFFVFLGSSAAIFGSWLERNGPRKAGVVAAFSWAGGFFISALGIYLHQIILLWIGSGLIGGCGLGLGYISPVSTLIKWFPDKRGMATGMAIMGFGGGAMIGAPLSDKLIKHFATETSVGVLETFIALGCIYFVAMMLGAFTYKIPPHGWKPHGWVPKKKAANGMITHGQVHVKVAHRTPQFWCLWGVLCLNVSAGIGIIGMASTMLQEIFGGKLIGLQGALSSLSVDQAARAAAVGAGFAGLVSLFNIGGRFVWASLSDHIGRKATYFIFFLLGIALYVAMSFAAQTKNLSLFVGSFCVIVSMYGGGFATIPAYLADMFGTLFVGAIHGRILTAWSTAGILGPVLVNYIREYQIGRGVPTDAAYSFTFYILAFLLAIGFVCNLLVRPVSKRWFMSDEEIREEQNRHKTDDNGDVPPEEVVESTKPSNASWVAVIISWLLVGIPMAWGVMKTVEKAAGLFK